MEQMIVTSSEMPSSAPFCEGDPEKEGFAFQDMKSAIIPSPHSPDTHPQPQDLSDNRLNFIESFLLFM